MVRRTILAIGIVCGASAAGALAFASELSRAGLHFVERAPWRSRGFTAVPPSPGDVHGGILPVPNGAAKGDYCPFPPKGGLEPGAVTQADTSLGAPVSSPARLVLEGQSTIPDSLPPALCTGGGATTTPFSPRLGKP